ncbi:MAG: hypothetical protein R3E42_19225 [Burkholderiaceae bacterium]
MTEHRFAWSVPERHPAFAGHFPGHPILPGVVLLDRVVMVAQTLAGEAGLAKGWAVSQTKFLSPVGPGEKLVFVLTSDARGGWRFVVLAQGERQVASGSLAALEP